MFGILILNYKTYDRTISLVNGLLPSLPSDARIVVVDNASPNDSYKILSEQLGSYPIVDVVESGENGGYAKGNNIGLRFMEKYSPEYVCVVNNDVIFDGSILNQLKQRYENLPSPGVIAPLQKTPDGSITKIDTLNVRSFLGELSRYSLLSGLYFTSHPWIYRENTGISNVQKVEFVPGSFLFMDYQLFRSLGYFDESTFLFWEEQFLYRKMSSAKRQNYIILDLDYIHDHSATINNDYDFISQSKLLSDGFKAYVRAFMRFPSIKCGIIDICSSVSIARYRIIRKIKRIFE